MAFKFIAILLVFFLLALPCLGQTNDATDLSSLQAELLRMYETDQKLRRGADSLHKVYGPNSDQVRQLWAQQKTIDQKNLTRLRAIISEHGWPKTSNVGKPAATAAFLILQHAGLEDQKAYLPLVRSAWAAGEVSGQHMALLEDRIRLQEDRPQLYGTQLVRDELSGELKLYPIQDEASVDERRAQMGMWSLKEYLELQGIPYKHPKQ